MNVLKINPQTLQPGDAVADFSATTFDGKVLGPEAILGKRAWIILYRYAGCPLCADNLADLLPVIQQAQAKNTFVAAVYGCRSDQFINPKTGRTSSLLANAPLPLIADPDKLLYRRFRTQIRFAAIWHPHAFFRLIRALLRGFRQASIDGPLGQVPAHVILTETGVVKAIYYGSHIADHPSLEWLAKNLGLDLK